MGNILEHIYQRRSIRKYKPDPIPRETLLDLLRAAMAAPSAVNKQPWDFIVVTQPERLATLQDVLPYGKYPCPAAIVVCGRLDLAQTEPDGSYWVQDCSAATENLLLAAAGLGLGTVWVGVYPICARVEAVQKVMNIPPFAVPLNVILVGYPDEEKPPQTRFRDDRVHWETW